MYLENMHQNQFEIFNPYIIDEGETITTNNIDCNLYGILVDAGNIISPITHLLQEWSNIYTVPDTKKLVITNLYTNPGTIHIDGYQTRQGYGTDVSLGTPLVLESGQTLAAFFSSFNGYLVDEDYFSSAASGANTSGFLGESISSVSQYNDTLYLNDGNYLIIPGLSQSNLHYQFMDYGSVTDVDGNEYKTLVYGDQEWMIENLKTNIGDFSTLYEADNFDQILYPDSIGHYYSSSDINSCCPEGWHVPTLEEWQELHYEIYGNTMNPNGFTNSYYDGFDNNYKFLWNINEGGTNQAFFNLFSSGTFGEGSITYPENATNFLTNSPNGNGYWQLNIYNENNNGNAYWGFDVGGGGFYKTQIRCKTYKSKIQEKKIKKI